MVWQTKDSPLWLGDMRVHYSAWRWIISASSTLQEDTSIDPLLDNHKSKLRSRVDGKCYHEGSLLRPHL